RRPRGEQATKRYQPTLKSSCRKIESRRGSTHSNSAEIFRRLFGARDPVLILAFRRKHNGLAIKGAPCRGEDEGLEEKDEHRLFVETRIDVAEVDLLVSLRQKTPMHARLVMVNAMVAIVEGPPVD